MIQLYYYREKIDAGHKCFKGLKICEEHWPFALIRNIAFFVVIS